MAEAMISDLSPAASLALTDKLEVEQGTTPTNSSKYVTGQQVVDLVQNNLTPIIESVIALSIVSGVVTINLGNGANRNFTLLLNANVTSIVFTNPPAAGKVAEFDLQFTQDVTGGRTVVLPASMKTLGASDTIVADAANAVTVLSAKTFDQGTTWRYAMQESA